MPFGLSLKKNVADKANKQLTVNQARCPQNHICPSISVCPVDALTQDGFAAPTVNHEKCILCGKCVRFCPMKALKLE
jgi:ferredoxin